ncbi:glycosyltransferase family 1 protein [Ceraceosorus bombacis]|uniref:UDP-N-acetylglucosamine transferase subunit ALG13 n=1 Tax=Ceraceosorus bombacis TaxID=401625 RepID=A0A0P1BAF3_9BASI|nr:glycosyltransferase family 1 protein [Ceraceosorus bombacis]
MASPTSGEPLRVLVTVGSTSFPALLTAALSDDVLRQLATGSQSLRKHSASTQPTLLLQHGATPLASILQTFLAKPVDPSSRKVPEAGLRKVGTKWGYTGAVRTELDPGEEGLLNVKLASSSKGPTHSKAKADSRDDADEKDAAIDSAIRDVKSRVRRRTDARKAGADVELDEAVSSALRERKASQSKSHRQHQISEMDEQDDTNSSSSSSSDLEDWNMDARPSGPLPTGHGTQPWTAEPDAPGGLQAHRLQLETSHGVHLTLIDYVHDLSEEISRADVVICHAGAGTILESLRSTSARDPPKVLVVPNTTLMDNHQSELADELARLDYCKAGSVRTLHEDLRKLLDSNTPPSKLFPPFEPERFAQIVDDLVGFS